MDHPSVRPYIGEEGDNKGVKNIVIIMNRIAKR